MALIPQVRSMPVVVVSAIILAFGLWVIVPDRTAAPADSAQTQVSSFSYEGVEGKDALTLLKETHQVETQTSSFGEFVVSINGVTPNDSQFWGFYVNDQLADVGAGSYITKTGDVITWKLDAIQ